MEDFDKLRAQKNKILARGATMNTQEQAIKDLESAKEYSKEFECEVVPFKDAKTIISQAIQTEREKVENGYDDAVANLRVVLGREPKDEEIAAMSIARNHVLVLLSSKEERQN